MIEYVVVYGHVVTPNVNKIPMILKDKPAYLKGVLNLPGGKIEEGESIVEAAVRELQEETGLDELEKYDDSCYFPSEHFGTIVCDECMVYCVRVPVVYQPLTPKATETELVEWYDFYEVLNHPKLMPNLRVIMPLIHAGHSGWTIHDKGDSWRDISHEITIQLKGMAWFNNSET